MVGGALGKGDCGGGFPLATTQRMKPVGWNSGWKWNSENGGKSPRLTEPFGGGRGRGGAPMGRVLPLAGAPAVGGGWAGRLFLGGDHVVDGLALFQFLLHLHHELHTIHHQLHLFHFGRAQPIGVGHVEY